MILEVRACSIPVPYHPAHASQLRHVRWRQRTVKGHELVMLVLAHDIRAPFNVLLTNQPRPEPHRPRTGSGSGRWLLGCLDVALTGTSSLTRCRLSRVETDRAWGNGNHRMGVVPRVWRGRRCITAERDDLRWCQAGRASMPPAYRHPV